MSVKSYQTPKIDNKRTNLMKIKGKHHFVFKIVFL